MAEEKQKPDEDAPKGDDPAQADAPEPLSDEDVNKLFANISEEAAKADEASPDNEDESAQPPADSPPPTFDPKVLASPEGQKAIQDAVNQALASKATDEASQVQAKKLQEWIDSDNNDALAEWYKETLKTQQAGQGAVDGFLTTFYRTLFSDPMFQNLTAEERKEIEPDGRFQTDADYVKHLSKFMANKQKTALSSEELDVKLAERVEALKRDAAGKKVRTATVQGAAPADGVTPPRPSDARSLISEGLRETFPDAYAE